MSDTVQSKIDFETAIAICLEQGCRFEGDTCSTLWGYACTVGDVEWCEQQGTVTTAVETIKQMCDTETGKDSDLSVWDDVVRKED